MGRGRGKSTSPHAMFVKAMVKAGAAQCPNCRDYVSMETHGCLGEPSVSSRWEWAYSTQYVATPHHDPIDPEWVELEAEAINQEHAA